VITRGISLGTNYDTVLQRATSFVRERHLLLHWRVLVLAFLFMAAVGVRMLHVNEPPLNFHATRQYRSLLITRGYYYERLSSAPEWKKQIARINQQRQGILEPPVMELLTSVGYSLFGGEQFWIPRSLSILFWLVGGGFLYLIAKKIADVNASLFSTAFYLFLPFAVSASRSFQPDPLMVMLLLASTLAILQYFEQHSLRRLAVLFIIPTFTIFVKPISLFIIYTVFLLLALHRQGIKSTITNPRFLLFFPVTILPTLLFSFYGILTGGVLRAQARSSFLPQVLLDPFFWRGWLNNIQLVVGFNTLIVALLGTLIFRKGLPRVLLVGLWIGYVFFCLVFNYHIATHDYYHLQLVPIVALSLGSVGALIFERLEDINRDWYWRMSMWAILLLALALSLNSARSMLADRTSQIKVKMAEEIGELVNHSANTVYLSGDYGLPLEYHGELSGKPWPLVSDLEWERLAGVSALDAEERFSAWFSKDSPEYFIVEDLREFEQQPDLKRFLSKFSIMSQSNDYLIFKLKGG
jgi:Dolichyl-phosphate-mannose-protein mannosyltransferase